VISSIQREQNRVATRQYRHPHSPTEEMKKYAVVFERGTASYGAYAPDLPGCIAVGKTRAEVEKLIAEAISLHIESLVEHGDPVPDPSSEIEYIEPLTVL